MASSTITLKQGQSFTDTAGRTGIVNYDTKTGKKLSTGGTTTLKLTSGQSSKSSGGNTTVYEPTKSITPTDLTSKYTDIPTYTPSDLTDYGSVLKGIESGSASMADIYNVQNQTAANTKNDLMKLYETAYNEKPSTAQLYKEALKESGKEKAQQEANNQQAKLNQIITQAQAAQIALTGQGRGIAEGIIGGQQAQIAREAAIQALPVSAALQAAQGNLEMANDNLNTLFKIKTDDATNEFTYKTKLIDTISQFATKQQENQLQMALKTEERKYQEKLTAVNEAKKYADMAFANNQSSLGSKIAALDTNSPTYKTELAKLTGQIYDPVKDLDRQIKKAQLDNLKAPQNVDAPTVKAINGVDKQWNPKTQKWEDISVGEVTSDSTVKSLENLSWLKKTAEEAIKLSDKAGIAGANKFLGDLFVGDTGFRRLESQTNTLRTNVLTLMTDPAVKKFFGPQMSEADVRLMTAGGTTLNPDNQSPEMLKDEAGRLLNLFTRMENTVKQGIKEYQYVDSVAPVIDTSGTSISTDSYANSLYNN